MKDSYLSAKNLKSILFEIGTSLGIDTSIINERISKIKKEQITYLPVRHHSPGSTVLVKRWIKKYKPKLILVEGPAFADDLIQYMVDKDTRPPIALLSLYADVKNVFGLNGILSSDVSIPAKFEAYYPFVSYSPELIALSESMQNNIPVHFIDLPLTGLISHQTSQAKSKGQKIESVNIEKQSVYILSSFYQKFARVFDFENFDETWETLFEIGAQKSNIETLRENMLVFCAFVRQSIDAEFLKADNILIREAYMKYNIENYIKKYKVKEKEVLVITGGIHSVALIDSIAKNFTFPVKELINSLIPFSYYRLSQKSGYTSGNQAPQFYDNIWNKIMKKVSSPYEAVALETITDIYAQARLEGNIVSISDSINSFQGAKMLAMLRRREEPDLKDIIDSIYMVVVKGNPEIDGKYLNSLIQAKTIGYKVGKITNKIGKLPLQKDFYLQLENYGINIEEKKQIITLNLREESESKISQLFWKIKFLGIDYTERLLGPDVLKGITGTFTEKWNLQWNPRIDVKLVELSTYGSTLEEASKNMLVEETKKNLKNFALITTLLFQSLFMGYSDHIKDLYKECLNSLEQDNQFLSLVEGFSNIIMIYQYMLMLNIPKEILELIKHLIQRSYYTSCFSIPNSANPPTAEEVTYIDAFKTLANTLISIQKIEIDLNVYMGSIKTCMDNTNNEFIKGGTLGILYLMNYTSISDIKTIISGYLSSIDTIKVRVGDLIRGLIYVCQAKILFNQDIINVMATMVESINWDVFSAILPALRKAFSQLNPNEYEIFIEKLAEYYGLIQKKEVQFDEVVQEDVKDFFKMIDNNIRKIFEEWFGEV